MKNVPVNKYFNGVMVNQLLACRPCRINPPMGQAASRQEVKSSYVQYALCLRFSKLSFLKLASMYRVYFERIFTQDHLRDLRQNIYEDNVDL